MGFIYAVLGAGRQGTAAAYDLARFGDAEAVKIGDADAGAARRAAERVNGLLGRPVATGHRVGAADARELSDFLAGVAAVVSAVPFRFNLGVTRAAIAAGAHCCDFGGNTDVVRAQLALDAEARAAGVSVVPDCGLDPGLCNSLAVYAMERLDRADELMIWCGGLPKDPRPPFHYFLTFNVAGLTNEYTGEAVFLRDGEIVRVEAFTGVEPVDLPPPVGRAEAFVTSGGSSTLPWTYRGRLRRLETRTVRYPGHFAQFRPLIELGFLSEQPVEADGARIRPREVLHALLEAALRPGPGDEDLVVARIQVRGELDGNAAELTLDLLDHHDPETGFSAMERTTGSHGAIVAAMQARGEVAPGARPLEVAVPGRPVADALAPRGIRLTETLTVTTVR